MHVPGERDDLSRRRGSSRAIARLNSVEQPDVPLAGTPDHVRAGARHAHPTLALKHLGERFDDRGEESVAAGLGDAAVEGKVRRNSGIGVFAGDLHLKEVDPHSCDVLRSGILSGQLSHPGFDQRPQLQQLIKRSGVGLEQELEETRDRDRAAIGDTRTLALRGRNDALIAECTESVTDYALAHLVLLGHLGLGWKLLSRLPLPSRDLASDQVGDLGAQGAPVPRAYCSMLRFDLHARHQTFHHRRSDSTSYTQLGIGHILPYGRPKT